MQIINGVDHVMQEIMTCIYIRKDAGKVQEWHKKYALNAGN
jgi:hypothetical protein